MALLQPLETRFGFNADYWKHCTISISLKEGTVAVSLDGYFNQEKRDGNAPPIDTKPFTLVIGDPSPPVRVRKRGNPEFMPEGEAEVVETASAVPFLPLEVLQALQTAIYEAMKNTEMFSDAVDV